MGKISQCVHQEKQLFLNVYVTPLGTDRLGIGWCQSPTYGLKPH